MPDKAASYELVPEQELDEIKERLDSDENIHMWEVEALVKHFAYLVPVPLWFTEEQVRSTLDQLGVNALDELYLKTMKPLIAAGSLHSVEDVPRESSSYYDRRFRMDRRQKMLYENELPGQLGEQVHDG